MTAPRKDKSMNKIRFGLAATMLLGAIYAGFGLLISLRDFGIGLAVAAAAMVAYELTIFIESAGQDREWRRREERKQVWARRVEQYGGQDFWIDK